ncbi:threonine/serine exporter family protein [Aerococcus urinaeequi]|uniref:threonine/serine exporter family protein n=1 Tax=Aerococcus urinaeequi TaxID=51665 RepID=UPI0013183B5A|nr:threonine/serine exporter [Aerococcus viridans]
MKVMDIILQLIGAYGVGLFAILTIEGPRKVLFWTPLINIAGWGSYLISIHLGGFSEIMATYFGSLVIALISQMYARIFREPVTVFFIPAFFLFVPGGGMYRTALAFIQGDTAQGFTELGGTLFTALAIVLAVYTSDTFVQIINKQKFPKFIRKNYRVIPKVAKKTEKKIEKKLK